MGKHTYGKDRRLSPWRITRRASSSAPDMDELLAFMGHRCGNFVEVPRVVFND
jgi:hypothetical protein